MAKRKPNAAVLSRKLNKAAFAVEALARQIAQLDGDRYAASVDNAAVALAEAATRIEQISADSTVRRKPLV
jgi:predicted translin family RNA/ssDNA-binding protein